MFVKKYKSNEGMSINTHSFISLLLTLAFVLNSFVFVAASSVSEGARKLTLNRPDEFGYTYVYEVPADAEEVIVKSDRSMNTSMAPLNLKDLDFDNIAEVESYQYNSATELQIKLSGMPYSNQEAKEYCLDAASI